VQFLGRGLGFSTITALQMVLLEEEWSREDEAKILWVIQSHQEGR
jgi:hypothetical protein